MRDLYPREIKDKLDEYVIKQEKAKKALAVAVHNHFTALDEYEHNDELNLNSEVKINRNIVLLIGDTGVGKSHLCKTIAEETGLPYITIDVSKVSSNGYKGDNLVDNFKTLIDKAESRTIDAKYGMVYIDEIDKLRKGSNENAAEYKAMVQQELLSVLEGEKIRLEMSKGAFIEFDTSKLLIVLSGAFVGLNDIVKARINKKERPLIGFNREVKMSNVNLDPKVTTEDLMEFGLIPELLGRITDIVTMDKLQSKDLVTIMKNTKDSILEKHKYSFKVYNLELEFSDKFLKKVADNAISKGLGARGLRSELNEVMRDVTYNYIDSEKYTKITIKDYGKYKVEEGRHAQNSNIYLLKS